jgi:ribonuclease R
MEVERAIVDLYRTYMMKDHIGRRYEGTVTAVVGSGLFVQLDAPFVDVLIRLEDLGPNSHWAVDDDALRVVAARSGEVIALGERIMVEITDAAILRRTVYARRVSGDVGDARRPPRLPEKKGKSPADRRRVERAPRKDKGRGKPTAKKKGPRR